MMFIPVERMLMRWLTPITFSPCSRLASYCMRLSSTQHPSSSPSNMVSSPTRSHRLTSHAYESALTRPPPSQLWPQQTHGHFHKMVTSFAIRDYSMSPTIRTSDWTSFAPTTTIAWLDILASPRRSRTSVISSIGPKWSPLLPTTSTRVLSAVTASPSTTSHFGPHRFLPIGERPWDSISMDFIEGLPLSEGRDMILVVVCHLTKMALFIPTFREIDAEDLACIFLSQVFAKHGTPTDIVSDRGKHFISQFWRSLCQLLGIKANLSTAYHPEMDGQTEWVNQILEQYLWVYINYQQDDWVNLLPLAEFAYNNTLHSVSMVTPFFANKGCHPKLEVSLEPVVSETAHQVATDIKELHLYLCDQISHALKQYEVHSTSQHLPIPTLKVGDTVWLD